MSLPTVKFFRWLASFASFLFVLGISAVLIGEGYHISKTDMLGGAVFICFGIGTLSVAFFVGQYTGRGFPLNGRYRIYENTPYTALLVRDLSYGEVGILLLQIETNETIYVEGSVKWFSTLNFPTQFVLNRVDSIFMVRELGDKVLQHQRIDPGPLETVF